MKSSPHRPFVLLLFAYVLGIAAEYVFSVDIGILFICSFSCLLFVFLFVLKRKVVSFALLLIVMFLGATQLSYVQIQEKDNIVNEYKFHRSKLVDLEGVIVSDVRQIMVFNSTKISFKFKVEKVRAPWGWKNCSGFVLVNLFKDSGVAYGERLILSGKLHYPFEFSEGGTFSYKRFLKRKKIDLVLSVGKSGNVEFVSKNEANLVKSVSLKIRNKLREQLYSFLTKNEASIMKAMLLGDRTSMPKNVKTLFERTGTVHVLAISGLHVGIISGVCLLILNLIPILREHRYLLVCILLSGYCFMTGSRPSAIRATIMIVVVLTSYVVEKESDIFNTMCFAAFLILAFNPFFLFDIGFQLSFACVISIFLFAPTVEKLINNSLKFQKSRMSQYFLKAISISLSIWIGIVGFIAYYFQIITPITIVANIIVIPLVSIIVVLGCMLLIFAQASTVLPIFVASCLKVLLNIMAGIIFLLDKIPFSSFRVKDVTLWVVIVYYIVVFFVYITVKSCQKDEILPPSKKGTMIDKA